MASSYTIGSRYEDLVKSLVTSGRYASASEVIRDGLRLLEAREMQQQAKLEALRASILVGVDSGPGIPADSVFSELEERYSDHGRD